MMEQVPRPAGGEMQSKATTVAQYEAALGVQGNGRRG
jgi:hypothetical protein